jgi:putative transposase
VQYACAAHVEHLGRRKIAPTTSRPANPYDAKAESLMKTLKAEEVKGKAYANLDDARRQIGAIIETVCNAKPLHLSLGYKPPVEFEAELRPAAPTANRDEALSLV